LFYLSSYKNQYQQVNAIVDFKLNGIKSFLKEKKGKGVQKMYDLSLIKMIEGFQKNPTLFKKKSVPKIPDGSPIGGSRF
ncbi:MAG: hypothetical protein ACPG44_10340, partial [Polaribacter sp.]